MIDSKRLRLDKLVNDDYCINALNTFCFKKTMEY